MRVLQIIPSFGLGGAEQMAAHLMTGLAESFEVSGASLFAEDNNVVEQRLRHRNIRVRHLGKRHGFDPRMYIRLDGVLREIRPHVVHTHLSVLRYVLPVALRRRVPLLVHTLHNLAEYETDAFGRLVNRFAFRRAVLAVAISRQVAHSYQRFYGMPCRAVVPNGIPTANYSRNGWDRVHWRARHGFDREAVLFVSVARLDRQKNPFLLLEAFAALNNPQAQLLMLGNGELRDAAAGYVRDHGLADRVHLLGKRNEVAEYLCASDVFVLSSDWEGNPLAVMEAMAAGLPVISTAVGGVPELVEAGRSGILVPAKDGAALSQAMAYLIGHPGERQAMGQAAHDQAVMCFGLEQMVNGYAQVYRAALAAHVKTVSTSAADNFEVHR